MALTPAEIQTLTLDQLRTVRTEMMSPRWILSLEDESKDVQRDSALTLLRVQEAVLKLENQKLADIAAALKANDDEISKAIAAVKQRLKNVEQIKPVLDAIAKLIDVAAKVAPLVL